MEHAELEATVEALYKLVMAQQGVISAQRVMLDCVVSAVGSALPPLVSALDDNFSNMEQIARNDLEPAALASFDSTVSHFQTVLGIVARQ